MYIEYCGFEIDLEFFPDEQKRKAFLAAYMREYATQGCLSCTLI